MKKLTLFLFVATSFQLFATEKDIYNQIIKNYKKTKTSISKKYAKKLSKVINKYCLKHDIPCNIFAGILMQESRYKVNAKRCSRKKKLIGINNRYYWGKRCYDFGIGQIWSKTAKHYKFNINKLLTDLDYSVMASAIVLSDFKKWYGKKEKHWYTRYNASNKKKRQIYYKHIKRFF